MLNVKRIDGLVGTLLRGISVGCLAVISVLLTLNVLVRFVPVVSLAWFDEIIEMLFAWMVFLGAAALWREKEHFTVAFLPDWLKGTKKGDLLNVVINLVSLTFLLIFTYFALNLTIRAGDITPVLEMPKRLLYASMPLAGAIMTVYSLGDMVRSLGKLFGVKTTTSSEVRH